MTDCEKKIAEIRATVQFLRGSSKIEIDRNKLADCFDFLLSELDHLEREYAEERAAHNAHVTELCELEEENRKLREERDKWEKEARLQYRLSNEMIEEIRTYHEQLQSAQQDRDKLIEGLRWYADEKTYKLGVKIQMGSAFPLHEPIKYDKGQRARDILAKIKDKDK